MSIKTDAVVIRDETIAGANTATRVGTNLSDIADDLVAKQAAIDLNTAKETNIAHPLVETAVPVGAVFTDNDTVYDDTAIQAEVDLNTAKVGITAQQASDIATNNAKVGVTTEEANPDVVSQVEAEAGVATTERIWTAERVKQAIVALGGSGSVDDTAYGISWDGVTGVAPSKNALYDFIESQVFKVDASSNIIPIFWGGTQAEYDIDFPTGHDPEYFIVITDGAVSPTSASDIVNVPSGNLVATDVQGALDELQTELDAVSGGSLAVTTGTGTAIDLTNVVGAYYNIGASSTATAFTVPTVAVGGFAVVESASTTTEPTITVTGGTATEIPSLSWVVSTTMYLNIYSYDGVNVFYYWSDTVSSIDGFTASTISNASANAGLVGTEEVIINTSGVLEKTTTQDIANLGSGGGGLTTSRKQITSKGAIYGDSIVATWAGQIGMSTIMLDPLDTDRGDTIAGKADAGDTFAQQLTVWNADTDKANYDWIYVQMGANNIDDVKTLTTLKAECAALIDQINTDRKAGSVLIMGTVTPYYSQMETLFGVGAPADAAESLRVGFNDAILANDFGVDYVINSYEYLLGEPADRKTLATVYDTDGIHPNALGRQLNADEVRVFLNNLGFLATIDENDWTKPTVRDDAFQVDIVNADLNNIVRPIGNGTAGTGSYPIVIPNNTVLVDVEIGDKIEIIPKFGTNHTIDATAITLLDPLSLASGISVGFRYILEYTDTDTWLLDGSADVSALATKSGVIDFANNKFVTSSEFNNVFRYIDTDLGAIIIRDFATLGHSIGDWFEVIVDNATGTCTIVTNGSTTFKLKPGISVTAMADGEYRKAIKIDTDKWYITD